MEIAASQYVLRMPIYAIGLLFLVRTDKTLLKN